MPFKIGIVSAPKPAPVASSMGLGQLALGSAILYWSITCLSSVVAYV